MAAITLKYKNILWITLILIVGALVRFHGLGDKSLWIDEFESLQIAGGGIEKNSHVVKYSPLGVLLSLHNDVNVPLYYMLLNVWIRAFGNSEAAMRSLSAVFGIGSILLIYMVTNVLLHKRAGLISSLVLASAPLHISYAQEARGYALKVFLILLSTYFFIRIVFCEEKKSAFWFGYVVTALLAIYTHYFALFIYLFHSIFLLLYRRDLFFTRRWLLFQSMLVLAWLLPFVIWFNIDSFAWVQVKSPHDAYWPFVVFPLTLRKFTFAEYYTPAVMSISRVAFTLGVILFGFLFLLGLVALVRDHGSNKMVFLFLWLCVPILALIAIDVVEKTKASMVSRYLIAASPAYYIILSSGIAAMRNNYLKVGALVSILILFSMGLLHYYRSPQYEQWKEAAQYINGSSRQADLMIFYPGDLDFINYYVERRIPQQVIYRDRVSELEGINKELNLIFVMIKSTSPSTTPEDLNQIASLMGGYYRLAEVRNWGGVKILRYERK